MTALLDGRQTGHRQAARTLTPPSPSPPCSRGSYPRGLPAYTWRPPAGRLSAADPEAMDKEAGQREACASEPGLPGSAALPPLPAAHPHRGYGPALMRHGNQWSPLVSLSTFSPVCRRTRSSSPTYRRGDRGSELGLRARQVGGTDGTPGQPIALASLHPPVRPALWLPTPAASSDPGTQGALTGGRDCTMSLW